MVSNTYCSVTPQDKGLFVLRQGPSRRYCGAIRTAVTHRQAHSGRTLANTKTRARTRVLGPLICLLLEGFTEYTSSFSLKRTHRNSGRKKMQLKKKLMRHISCIPAQFLAVKAFTIFTQEGLTQLRRCWL